MNGQTEWLRLTKWKKIREPLNKNQINGARIKEPNTGKFTVLPLFFKIIFLKNVINKDLSSG